jgi:hypothetical protein
MGITMFNGCEPFCETLAVSWSALCSANQPAVDSGMEPISTNRGQRYRRESSR